MNKKIKIIIGVVVIIVFGYIAWTSFSKQMTPYVDFKVARNSGKTVQVIGKLVDGRSEIDPQTGALEFSLLEEGTGEIMKVSYTGGPKPGNFEQADKIVTVGEFSHGEFHSTQLLVKCPSKYQGYENEKPDSQGI